MTQNYQKSRKNLPGLFVRQRAAKLLDFVLAGNAFEPLSVIEVEDARDRALINRLVSMALRRHGHLNAVIAKLMQKGMPKRSGPFEGILRIGLVQLLFLEEMGEHSAIHLAVEAAKRDKRAGRFDRVLNGVLRQAQREATHWRGLDLGALFPPWLASEWVAHYGKENFAAFGKALLNGASLDLVLRDEDAELIAQLGGEGLIFDSIRIDERDCPVREMAGFKGGRWWVQDVAATLPARLFNLEKGARVLDMCAAPGGKTAQLIKAGYAVTALDNSPARLKRLRQNLERLGYGAQIVEGDAKTFSDGDKFGGVLVDAPCTATGTFRRHPEVLWQRQKSDVANRVALQRAIIANGVKCLAEGGELILCVCSLLKEEGEAQAQWVENNFPQLRGVPIMAHEVGGIAGAIDSKGWVRTHPGLGIGAKENSSMDGFFVARWRLA